jgi:hemerythrin
MDRENGLPTVAVDGMNETHREEAALIDTLLDQLEKRAGFESVSERFEQLIVHMQHHFASEEEQMQAARYPSFRMHKAEHDKVLNEARRAEMEWRNRKDEAALMAYLEEEVKPWLQQHIKAMDTPMADFVSQWEKYKGY